MKQEQEEGKIIASGATGLPDGANSSLALKESGNSPKQKSPSKKCNNLLKDGLQSLKTQSYLDGLRVKTQITKDEPELTMEGIVARYSERYSKNVSCLSLEEADVIGIALLRNFGILRTTAIELAMPYPTLKFAISRSLVLQEYHRLAQEGVKQLTDENLLEFLQNKDKDITKFIANLIYKGRKMGGFNPAEIGTSGYDDKTSQYIAAQTKDDQESAQTVVNFNFHTKPIQNAVDMVEDSFIEGDESE